MTHVTIDTRPRAARPNGVRALLWPGVSTLLMLLVLLGLGTWQLRRLAWKQAILAQIAAAEAAPPIKLPVAPSPFQKVSAIGHFLPGPTALYGVEVRDTQAGPAMGGQLLAPFATDGRVILVDRGWVPGLAGSTLPAGQVTVVGYARPPAHPWMFGVSDDLATRQFFTLDPAHIAKALNFPPGAPFTLVALGSAQPGDPAPATSLPRPPNNHLSYALTWYGLAAGLAVVCATWARQRLTE